MPSYVGEPAKTGLSAILSIFYMVYIFETRDLLRSEMPFFGPWFGYVNCTGFFFCLFVVSLVSEWIFCLSRCNSLLARMNSFHHAVYSLLYIVLMMSPKKDEFETDVCVCCCSLFRAPIDKVGFYVVQQPFIHY